MFRFFKLSIDKTSKHNINKEPKIFTKDKEWAEFLLAKRPIFWITGPTQAGKTTLAHFLSELTNYRLLQIKHLSVDSESVTNTEKSKPTGKHCPDYVSRCKQELKNTYKFSSGYIMDDFPSNMKECDKFVRSLCPPTVIIYIALSLDATLGRALAQNPTLDLNTVRINYVKQWKFSEKLYRKYEKSNKIIKVFSQYPIQDTFGRVLEILETDFPFKFTEIAKPVI